MNSVKNSTVQTVPNRTGFNYWISPDDPNNCPDKVIHLIKVKTDALQIAEVLDQDIYHNAL